MASEEISLRNVGILSASRLKKRNWLRHRFYMILFREESIWRDVERFSFIAFTIWTEVNHIKIIDF